MNGIRDDKDMGDEWMDIKQRIKNSKLAKCPLMIKHYCEDDKFRRWIELYNNPNVLIYEKLGEDNPDKRIYYMKFDNEAWGFFAYWKFMLIGLAFAEKYDLVPIVDWTGNSPYHEKERVDTDNPFEYFFEPVSDISVAEARRSACVVCSRDYVDKIDIFQKDLAYTFDDRIDHYTVYNKKYVRIRKEIQEQIYKEIYQLLENKQTIAVHIRGIEWGKIAGHPIPASLDDYFKLIDIAMVRYGFEQVFLATDSAETLDRCLDRYGKNLVFFTDVARSAVGKKTLMLFDQNLKRKSHHYLMGYEVLRDMLTLSMCDGLIAGLSNVSLAARVFKETRGEKYRYFETLASQEISARGMSVHRAVKMMKKKRYD